MRQSRGIDRLPSDLGEAIKALEGDQFLMDALGPVLTSGYLAIRRADMELFAGEGEAFELRHHFYEY